MPSLSVILIAKNEALHLPQCLASVRPIADEIVLVDTGSTDSTTAIAEDFGAKVSRFAWCDDFAAARNASIAAATGDWLLHMDADEALDPENAAAIRSLVDADGAGADAVEITLANYCDDPRAWRWVPVPPGSTHARGHSGYIKTTLLRLFRNGRGYAYREAVHENITPSVVERGGRIAASDLLIHHYGYAAPPEVRARKARQYLHIARAKARAAPENLKAQLDLAEQAFACGEAAEAEAASRAAQAIDPHDLPTGTMLANLLLNRGELVAAQAVLKRLPAVPHVHTALGAICLAQGRLEEAAAALDAAIMAQPAAPIALLYRARLHDQAGRSAAARDDLQRAHAVCPALPETSGRLTAHALREGALGQLRAGHPSEALKGFAAALQQDPEDPLVYLGIADALDALGHAPQAAENRARARRLAPALRTE